VSGTSKKRGAVAFTDLGGLLLELLESSEILHIKHVSDSFSVLSKVLPTKLS